MHLLLKLENYIFLLRAGRSRGRLCVFLKSKVVHLDFAFLDDLVLMSFEIVSTQFIEMGEGVLDASGDATERFDCEKSAKGHHLFGVTAFM